jgi:hypothetical protein
MRSRTRRLVAAVTPLLPVLALALAFVVDGAKRWR